MVLETEVEKERGRRSAGWVRGEGLITMHPVFCVKYANKKQNHDPKEDKTRVCQQVPVQTVHTSNKQQENNGHQTKPKQ